jgi:hypothetical protein
MPMQPVATRRLPASPTGQRSGTSRAPLACRRGWCATTSAPKTSFARRAASGTGLRLVVAAQIVRRVLAVCGLDRLVAIYPSLESATAARGPAVVLALPTRPARPHGTPGNGRGEIAPAVLRQMVDAFPDGVTLADDRSMIALTSMTPSARSATTYSPSRRHERLR